MAIKFNNGIGAVICNFCRVIIKEGIDDIGVTKIILEERTYHVCNDCYIHDKCSLEKIS